MPLWVRWGKELSEGYIIMARTRGGCRFGVIFPLLFLRPVPNTVLACIKDVGEGWRQPPEGAPRRLTQESIVY